jgi:hypothetical protein
MYEHLKVKPDGNLNVVNIMQYEQQVNLHASPQDYNNNKVDDTVGFKPAT